MDAKTRNEVRDFAAPILFNEHPFSVRVLNREWTRINAKTRKQERIHRFFGILAKINNKDK